MYTTPTQPYCQQGAVSGSPVVGAHSEILELQSLRIFDSAPSHVSANPLNKRHLLSLCSTAGKTQNNVTDTNKLSNPYVITAEELSAPRDYQTLVVRPRNIIKEHLEKVTENRKKATENRKKITENHKKATENRAIANQYRKKASQYFAITNEHSVMANQYLEKATEHDAMANQYLEKANEHRAIVNEHRAIANEHRAIANEHCKKNR